MIAKNALFQELHSISIEYNHYGILRDILLILHLERLLIIL
jgi:hypothetical protein